MRLICFCLATLLATPTLADTDSRFGKILNDHWQQAREELEVFRGAPESWRLYGLPSVTAESRSRRHEFNEGLIKRLDKIKPERLSEANRVSYQVFRYERELERESYHQLDHLYPINNRGGWHSYFATAPADMTISKQSDYESYLALLAGFPRYNTEHIALLKEALAAGHTQFCTSMEGFENSISIELVDNIEDSAFYKPLANIPTTIPAAERGDIKHRGRQLFELIEEPGFFYLVQVGGPKLVVYPGYLMAKLLFLLCQRTGFSPKTSHSGSAQHI